MRIMFHGTVWLAGIVAAAALAPDAQAQVRGRSVPGRYGVYTSSRGLRPVFIALPTFSTISVQTTVSVPDGGSVTVGGYSSLSEGRSEFGVPVLGKVPYIGRGFRNVGYGRRAVSRRVSVSVRVIDLREEEYRQTGVDSR
jgi:Flp pilus assembly secretin CpaC